MTVLTFAPTVGPSPGTTDKPTIKKLQADFGDGYSQAVGDGINYIRRELSLEWELLTPDQAVEITNFLRARGGVEPFYYTPSDELAPVKWTCDDWSDKRGQGGMRSVTAKFKQSFLL